MADPAPDMTAAEAAPALPDAPFTLTPIERVALAALVANPDQMRRRLTGWRRTPLIITGVAETWGDAVNDGALATLMRTAKPDVSLAVNRTPRGGPDHPADVMAVPDFLNAVFERRETARVFGLNSAHFPAETIGAFRPPSDLLSVLPIRDRYFGIETGMLFIGNNASVDIHYDREWNDLMHIALAGRRRITVFPPDQNIALYKLPLISDSALDFCHLPADAVGLDQAVGQQCILEPGEMLVLPARYWHFIEYIEPSAAVSYSYYTNRVTWALGTLNGFFYNGFSVVNTFHQTRWFRRWGSWYARTRAGLRFGRSGGLAGRGVKRLGLWAVDLSERVVYCALWYPMLFWFLARYRGGTDIYSGKS